jgi:hypothetical protein
VKRVNEKFKAALKLTVAFTLGFLLYFVYRFTFELPLLFSLIGAGFLVGLLPASIPILGLSLWGVAKVLGKLFHAKMLLTVVWTLIYLGFLIYFAHAVFPIIVLFIPDFWVHPDFGRLYFSFHSPETILTIGVFVILISLLTLKMAKNLNV